MVYAVFSCAHFSNGYFHPYDVASTIEDLDFWVHVGDYVYEYGIYSTYASDVEERDLATLPAWEQISLQDHRNRMATYHTDEGLRNLRRRAPMIAVSRSSIHQMQNRTLISSSLYFYIRLGMTTRQQIMRLVTDSRDPQALKITNPSAQRTHLPQMPIRAQRNAIETRAILLNASRLQLRLTSNGCRSAPAQEKWALLTWQASPKSSNGAPWPQSLPLILALPTVQWHQHLPVQVSQSPSLSS
jgi:hypothetical protein